MVLSPSDGLCPHLRNKFKTREKDLLQCSDFLSHRPRRNCWFHFAGHYRDASTRHDDLAKFIFGAIALGIIAQGINEAHSNNNTPLLRPLAKLLRVP